MPVSKETDFNLRVFKNILERLQFLKQGIVFIDGLA